MFIQQIFNDAVGILCCWFLALHISYANHRNQRRARKSGYFKVEVKHRYKYPFDLYSEIHRFYFDLPNLLSNAIVVYCLCDILRPIWNYCFKIIGCVFSYIESEPYSASVIVIHILWLLYDSCSAVCRFYISTKHRIIYIARSMVYCLCIIRCELMHSIEYVAFSCFVFFFFFCFICFALRFSVFACFIYVIAGKLKRVQWRWACFSLCMCVLTR